MTITSNGLIEQVDVAVLIFRDEPDRHGLRPKGFPSRIDPVKKLIEALPFELWKHLAYASSDECAWTRNGDIGVIDVLEDVVRAGEHADEARHLLKDRTLPLALGSLPSFRENPSGGLDDNRDDSGRISSLIGRRRVIEVHPDLLGLPASIERQFLVAVRKRAARQTDFHGRCR